MAKNQNTETRLIHLTRFLLNVNLQNEILKKPIADGKKMLLPQAMKN